MHLILKLLFIRRILTANTLFTFQWSCALQRNFPQSLVNAVTLLYSMKTTDPTGWCKMPFILQSSLSDMDFYFGHILFTQRSSNQIYSHIFKQGIRHSTAILFLSKNYFRYLQSYFCQIASLLRNTPLNKIIFL